jgi:Ca2+/Na+ antiporter
LEEHLGDELILQRKTTNREKQSFHVVKFEKIQDFMRVSESHVDDETKKSKERSS